MELEDTLVRDAMRHALKEARGRRAESKAIDHARKRREEQRERGMDQLRVALKLRPSSDVLAALDMALVQERGFGCTPEDAETVRGWLDDLT